MCGTHVKVEMSDEVMHYEEVYLLKCFSSTIQ